MARRTTKDLSPDEFYAKLKKQRERPKATIITGVLLAVFLALVFFVMPPQLPWAMQKFVGVLNATLAMLLVVFGVKEYGKKHQTVDLPFWKKISVGMVGGGALFALVIGWWLSPLAPIKVGMQGADEVARLLGDELTLAVLVMPDTTLAVIESPVPPASAATSARRISNDADPHSKLVKAIAERRYIEAGALATQAEEAGVDAVKLALARGQLAVFSGKYSDALVFFDKAAASGSDVTIIAQQAVANALAGNLNKAYEIASRLLDSARAGEVTGATAIGLCLNLKAALAVATGRMDEAVRLIEDSQLTWGAAADNSPHKAASSNNQAVVYAMLPKKYAGAESQFDGATRIWRELYGFDSAHVAGSRNNLGVLAISQANFADAKDRLENSLVLAQQNYPTGSPGRFPSLNALVRLNTLFGRYREAEQYAEDARKSTSQSPQLEMAHHAAMGALLTGQGAFRDAAGSFGKALDIGKQVTVPDQVFLADVRSQKAALNSLRGRYAETISECQAAIAVFDKQFGSNHPLVARTCNTLGWEYVRADKKPESRKQFDRAQEIFAANRNEIPLSPDEGQSLAGLAQTLPRRSWNEAVNHLRDAVKIEAEAFGPALGKSEGTTYVDTPATADYLFDEAMIYTQFGGAANYEKAADLFERALAMREKLLPKSHPIMAATYQGFATLLMKMDKKEQAKAMEKKAVHSRELAAKNN